MIHLLEVGPELDLKSLKKLSRKYAMTGGYELALRQDLTPEQALELYELHLKALSDYSTESSTYFTNNSYRILILLSTAELLPEELCTKLIQLLDRDSITAENSV